jgi:hypothetical protein
MFDRKFTFSVSLRAVVFAIVVTVVGASGVAIAWHAHARRLEEQKAEYRRRLRFLDQSTKAFSEASEILQAWDKGDTAFGIAREKAVDSNKALRLSAVTSVEFDLAMANSRFVQLYSDCRGQIESCNADLDAAELNYSRLSDELVKQAKSLDWKPAVCNEDDPYTDYQGK